MAATDELVLNLTGVDSTTIPQKTTRKGVWDRGSKSDRATRRGRGSKFGSRPGRGQGSEALPTPAALSNLKGYQLDGPEEATPIAPSVRGDTGAAERPLTGRDSLASPGSLPGPAPPPEEDGNDEGALLEAISLSLGKDRKLDAEDRVQPAAASSSEDEGGPGVVSFVDERHSHLAPTKRRRIEHPVQSTKQKRKGLGSIHPKAGELTHTGGTVPESQREVVFGNSSALDFAGLGLADSLASYLEALNFTNPTRIQQQAIPALLAGKDALINAPTGSGKTLVYLAPIIHDLQAQHPRLNRGDGTCAIIVAPTRELCLQICDALALILRRYHWLVGGAIIGGENRGKEKARLRKGITVVVATPGRLLDHLQSTTAFHTSELRWLVLDEADRLLDLGFQEKIQVIVSILDQRLEESGDRKRQTVLLSATMHSQLTSLLSLSLRTPVKIGFRPEGPGEAAEMPHEGTVDPKKRKRVDGSEHLEQFSIPEQLKQRYLEVTGRQRLAALAGILRQQTRDGRTCKLVVFMSSCDGVEFHHQLFQDVYKHLAGKALLECPIWKLHGNLEQSQRTQAFLDFSRCSRGVLFCTDVAARGLDFPAVTCIVQYDPPGEATEYVHRVGRTARMGRKGEAILFLLPAETGYLNLLEGAGHHVAAMDLWPVFEALPHTPTSSGRHGGSSGHSSDMHSSAFAFQGQLMGAIAKDPGLKALAGDAFRSFVRAYATHPASLRDVFHVRRLHLGHVAHSFALKEAPSLLGRSVSKAASKEEKKRKTVSSKKGMARR